MRIAKYIANAGICSRREAEKLILYKNPNSMRYAGFGLLTSMNARICCQRSTKKPQGRPSRAKGSTINFRSTAKYSKSSRKSASRPPVGNPPLISNTSYSENSSASNTATAPRFEGPVFVPRSVMRSTALATNPKTKPLFT